jgi:hypothetical protein
MRHYDIAEDLTHFLKITTVKGRELTVHEVAHYLMVACQDEKYDGERFENLRYYHSSLM